MTVSSRFTISPGGALRGVIRVPGDKSISHRAVMLGSIATGSTRVSGFLEGEDVLATMDALRSLGVAIEGPEGGGIRISGAGKYGLRPAPGPLYLGNAGTAMRLMAGLLAGQGFDSVLTGDPSLNSRPMQRVCEPLTRMGAQITAASGGTPPLEVHAPPDGLRGIRYEMPVASAQVKSCLLLAGLYADGITCVTEPAPTRDHTERMLQAFGCEVTRTGSTVCVDGAGVPAGTDIEVPGDFSSAAFFLVGASIAEDSDLLIENVGVNPTRTGAIEILRMMGADITLHRERVADDEPVADLRVRYAGLRGVEIPSSLVALSIDEFPALFVAAAFARGRTSVSGASELRVKESDRIEAVVQGLRSLGLESCSSPDGLTIEGGALTGGTVESRGDHRIAMAFSMAGLRAGGTIVVTDCRNVATSFPGFARIAAEAGLRIEEMHG